MSPKAYQKAREQDQGDVTLVDGRPYFPRAVIDDNPDMIKQVAAQIVLYPFTFNGDKSWKHLTVQKVSGGITNTLFRVSGWNLVKAAPDKPPSASVLVRIFGAQGMIDRDVENATYAALSRVNIAPPYYGRFANGRIEGWMEGFHHLTVRQVAEPQIQTEIAKALAKMHVQFQIPDDLKDYHQKPTMWTQLHDWLDQARCAQFQTDHDTTRAASLQLSTTISTEIAWLEETCIPANAAIVFCHNDLLGANVLWNQSEIQLIDFEYGGINYRSFDIANHFCEYAGGPPDDETPHYEWFPDLASQRRFIQTYLENAADEKPTATQVEDLLQQVQGFIMVSHLYWGLWAVNQAATEGCQEYDYMLFGMNRIQQYWVSKREWLQN